MKEWQLQEAKAKFSEVVAGALEGQEQVLLNGVKRLSSCNYRYHASTHTRNEKHQRCQYV
jgi:hypothetical protein